MAHSSKYSLVIICIIITAVIAFIGLASMRRANVTEREALPVKSMKSWQRADAPLGYSVNGTIPPFDNRFIQLSGFERSLVPISTQFHHPMGSTHGALTYNAQPFWSINKKRGGHHTGDDYNGIGGMNSDLGDPVFASSHGLVIYRGEPSRGWGNILILAHKDKDGQIHNTMYAHLDKSYAPLSQLIARGDTIGTVGTANNNYPAHLHFELRKSSGIYIGGGYRNQPGENLSTERLMASQINKTDHIYTPPLTTILRETLEAKMQKLQLSISK